MVGPPWQVARTAWSGHLGSKSEVLRLCGICWFLGEKMRARSGHLGKSAVVCGSGASYFVVSLAIAEKMRSGRLGKSLGRRGLAASVASRDCAVVRHYSAGASRVAEKMRLGRPSKSLGICVLAVSAARWHHGTERRQRHLAALLPLPACSLPICCREDVVGPPWQVARASWPGHLGSKSEV